MDDHGAPVTSTGLVVWRGVLGAPAVLRWFRRSPGALVIGFAAKLAVADR